MAFLEKYKSGNLQVPAPYNYCNTQNVNLWPLHKRVVGTVGQRLSELQLTEYID